MIELGHDVLILIVEMVDLRDLTNLRLVSKGWRSAVGDAAIQLRPCPELFQRHQLPLLCTAMQSPMLQVSYLEAASILLLAACKPSRPSP